MDSTDSSLVYRSTWSDYDQRLKSFNNWPLQIKQTSQDMAQAGFIYTGSSDRVFCFECKVGLKRWESNDNVWLEHKKWSPSCQYIRMVGVCSSPPSRDKPYTLFNTAPDIIINGEKVGIPRDQKSDTHCEEQHYGTLKEKNQPRESEDVCGWCI